MFLIYLEHLLSADRVDRGGSATCLCLKHRPSFIGSDIAINRISCTAQKLQAMLAIVQIGRGGWRLAEGRASGPEKCHWQRLGWRGRACAPARAFDGSDSAAVFKRGASRISLRGRNEPAQTECWGCRGSGDWFCRDAVGGLLLLPLGGKHPE